MPLIDDLQPLSLADYEHVIGTYAAECISIPGVHAIYQFGNIGAPGLSDVDLVVVLDDDMPPSDADLERLSIVHERWRREPLVRACFVHDVYVFPRSVFTHVDWLFPGNQWTRRAGAEENRQAPLTEEREVLAVVHGLDFCIARLQELAQFANRSSHSVRALVPQLWSLTHTRRILADAGVVLERSWGEVVGALENMRATPVGELSPADVAGLVPVVLEHFEKAVDHFAVLLAERSGLGMREPTRECSLAVYPRRALHVYRGSAANGADTQVSAVALARSFRFGRRTVEAAWSRLDLPGTVLVHHLAYLTRDARYHGIAHRIARRGNMPAGESGSAVYRRVIATRWELAQRSDQPLRAGRIRLSGFRIPGLPVTRASGAPERGTWRFRALRSWLDWRLLPAGVVDVGRG